MADPFESDESFEEDVGLGQEDKKHARSNQVEWFKGEKGRSYRAGLVYFHPLSIAIARALKKKNPGATKEQMVEAYTKVITKRAEDLKKAVDQLTEAEKLDLNNVQFKKIKAMYKEGVGYVVSRLGLDGSDADDVWKMMGEEKIYFSSVLVFYPTNKDGEPIKEQLATGWTVKPWRFGPKVYGRLHQVAASMRENDLSIAGQDLMLKCTNTDFQNFDVDPGGKALWRRSEAFQAEVLAKAIPLYEKLNPFRTLSTADLRIKLGVDRGGGGQDVSDDDFSGLMSQV